ncbi:MAG: IPT/TIG domain-containing protein [Terriglobia bacterium]
MKQTHCSFTMSIICLAVVFGLFFIPVAPAVASGTPSAQGDSLSITGVTPNSGPVTGGTPIRVSGTDFSNGATLSVKGITAVNIVRVEENLITAVTPAVATPGPADVTVTLQNGKSVTLAGGFTYTTNQTAAPTSSAQFIPYVVDDNSFRSNLILTNMSANQATVTVTFVDDSGTIIGSKSYSIVGNGRIQLSNVLRDILESSVPTNKTGYLQVESNQSLSMATTPIDNSTNSSSVVQGTRGRGTHLLLPSSTSVGAFKTTLTLVNDDKSQNEIEIKLRGDDGTTKVIRKVELAAYGFFHVEDLHAFLGVNGSVGAVELRSSGSIPAQFVAVSKVYAPLTTQGGSAGTVSSFFIAEPIQ